MRDHRVWYLTGAIILLGTGLMTYNLASREVSSQDEPLSIARVDQSSLAGVVSASSVRAVGVPTNAQPLHPLLLMPFWSLIGHNVFVLRFSSVLFGVCNLALAYKAGELFFGRRTGLVAALLLALFPLHLRYAQIFRFYAMLVTFSLAALVCLWQALKTNRSGSWIGFVLFSTLAVYTHFNALFALTAAGLFVLIILLSRMVAELQSPADCRPAARSQILAPILSLAAVGLLIFPALVRLIKMPWMPTTSSYNPTTVSVPVQWTFSYFGDLLRDAGLVPNGILWTFIAFTLLGIFYTFAQGLWRQGLLLLLWTLVIFVALSFLKTPDPLRARHLVFVVPALLLFTAQGVVALSRALDAALVHLRVRSLPAIGLPVATLLLALAMLIPLSLQYRANREWARLEPMIGYVERHAQPGDVIVVSRRVFLRPLDFDETITLDHHPSSEELDRLVAGHNRAWVIHSSFLPGPVRESVDLWVANDDFVSFGVGNTIAVSYRDQRLSDREEILKDRVTLTEDVVQRELLLRRGHRIQTLDALQAAYRELAELAEARGDTTLAGEYLRKADWAKDLPAQQQTLPDE